MGTPATDPSWAAVIAAHNAAILAARKSARR
jgi:hypothetical protein